MRKTAPVKRRILPKWVKGTWTPESMPLHNRRGSAPPRPLGVEGVVWTGGSGRGWGLGAVVCFRVWGRPTAPSGQRRTVDDNE